MMELKTYDKQEAALERLTQVCLDIVSITVIW